MSFFENACKPLFALEVLRVYNKPHRRALLLSGAAYYIRTLQTIIVRLPSSYRL